MTSEQMTEHNMVRGMAEPELTDCHECRTGVVERVLDDYAPDTGATWKYVGGSSWDRIEGIVRCPDCTKRNAA